MRVTAIATGYHGKLRQAGETFEVPQGAKGSWYVPAEPAPVPVPPAAKKATTARNQTPPAPPAGGQPGGGSDDLV